MTVAANIDATLMHEWVAAKLDPDAVEKKLQEKGFTADEVKMYLKEFRKVRNARRLSAGMVYITIGSVVGCISTFLSIFNPIPELYYYILYGLTSVAVLILFWGLYFIFE